MPDNEINWNLTGHDDISPILRAVENELAKVGAAGAMAGKQFAEGFEKAKISLETASKMQELSGLPMQSALKAYVNQITAVNSSIKYLFEQRGGVEALLLEQGKKGFERQFRDPYGKPPTPIEMEGMNRLADATAKAASEMASLSRFQKEARAESERLAISMENVAEMAKQADLRRAADSAAEAASAAKELGTVMRDARMESEEMAIALENIDELIKQADATRLANAEAQAKVEAQELSAFEKEAAQYREQSAINLEKIAELEGIARKEAEARAVAEKEAAEAEAVQLAESLERIRAMKPAIPYEEGSGGVGKHFGGFLQQAFEGLQRGGPMEALSRGIESFGRGMLSMASWILEWELIQKAFELSGAALDNLVKQFQIGYLWANRLGGATRETAASFDALKSAAWFSGQSLEDTFKRVEEFRTHGFSADQAVREAQIVGDTFRKTNVDITDSLNKAKEYGAGIEDLRKIAQAGHPELLPEVDKLSVEQNLRPVEQMIRARNHELQQRKMEDTVTAQQREMEEHQRLEEDSFQQSTRLMEREMQARHMARNRDLEDEQRNIEQSMQARHRAQTQMSEDLDIAHQRAVSHASAFKGLAEAILEGGRVIGRSGRDVTGMIPTQYISTLRDQMQAGAAAMGLSWRTAQTLGREGIVSPGSLIQAGEEARQDQRRQESRARELESINTGIQLQKKAMEERRQQQNDELAMTHQIQDDEYAMQKRNQITRMAFEYALQDTQRKNQRDYQNQEFAFQLKYGALQLYISQRILEIHEEDNRKRIEAEKKLHGTPPPEGLERGRLPPGAASRFLGIFGKGEGEGAAQPPREQRERTPEDILRDYIRDLQQDLKNLDIGVEEQKKSTDAGTISTQDTTKSNTELTDVNKDNTTATTDNNKTLSTNTDSLNDLKGAFDKYHQKLEELFGKPPGGAGEGGGRGGGTGGTTGGGGGGISGAATEGGMSPEGQANLADRARFAWSRQPHVGGELPPWASKEERLQKQLSDWSRQPHVGGELHPWDPGGFMYEAAKQKAEEEKRRKEAEKQKREQESPTAAAPAPTGEPTGEYVPPGYYKTGTPEYPGLAPTQGTVYPPEGGPVKGLLGASPEEAGNLRKSIPINVPGFPSQPGYENSPEAIELRWKQQEAESDLRAYKLQELHRKYPDIDKQIQGALGRHPSLGHLLPGPQPGKGFEPDYSKPAWVGDKKWWEVKPPGMPAPSGEALKMPPDYSKPVPSPYGGPDTSKWWEVKPPEMPTPGREPTSEAAPPKGKETGLATEGTLTKIEKALEKVFTGSGG